MHDLHVLGWQSFQQLCLTITREILGQTVESFLNSHDGGRDGAFTGTWRTDAQEDLKGPFVIQCKFTGKSGHVLNASALAHEAEKVRKLVVRGICESYIIMTNAGVTGRGHADIVDLFSGAGAKHVKIFDSTWITNQIQERKELRRHVPRLYGLGDLSQILDGRAYDQAQAILDEMREDLAKVIVTDAYKRAVEAIDKHSFVLLVGEPAVGKTTIASLLAMAALDEWGASPLKIDGPGEFQEHWNPHEPSQFFWLDDAFGVTQYEGSLAYEWNRVFPNIRAILSKGAKIVLTSRDYIYSRARKELKENAFPLLNESQVVIDVQDLTPREKQQILYNHLKLGNQPNSFRTEIKPYLDGVASHPRFIPETARRLSDPLFTRDLLIYEDQVYEFVEKREQILQDILQSLDVDSKAALALIYMRTGNLVSPIKLSSSERLALELLGSDLGRCVAALEALKSSLVMLSFADGEYAWKFKHPTIGDAYGYLLSRNPEYLDIYVRGSESERLIEQVTCGDVGLENAIVIPSTLFPQVLAKLKALQSSRHYRFGVGRWLFGFEGFLIYRCSKEFLSLYLKQDLSLLDMISRPGLFLDSVTEVRLAKRLQELGILPEEVRKNFVKSVSDYAIDGMDGSALSDDGIRNFFTKDELDRLLQRVKSELLPRLNEVRWEWESNCPPDLLPEDYMQPLLEFFDSLKIQFTADGGITNDLDYQVSAIYEWVDENMPEGTTNNPQQLGGLGASEGIEGPGSRRSIFDDIDAEDDVIGG